MLAVVVVAEIAAVRLEQVGLEQEIMAVQEILLRQILEVVVAVEKILAVQVALVL
jgi:hypothetical protein